jgi:pimeloyl-ACP methyl ester carboxylesterase
MKQIRFWAASFLVVLLVSVGMGPIMSVAQAMTIKAQCPEDTESVDNRTPLISVHGLNSDSQTWLRGVNPMKSAIDKIKEVEFVNGFDYSADFTNLKWVTEGTVGSKLMDTVSCYADESRKNGGTGKVILVGHSMGGLLIQSIAGKVVDKLAGITTIGTPYRGSVLGNVAAEVVNSYCLAAYLPGELLRWMVTKENCASSLAFTGLSIGSKELAELPKFPAGIPVKAIAGDVTPQMQLGAIKITAKASSDSDNVVHVGSATAESTSKGAGDGKKVIGCTGVVLFAMASDAPCAHTNQLNDVKVQQEVRKSVEQYLAAARGKVTDFYGLQLRLPPEWKVEDLKALPGVRTASDKTRCMGALCVDFTVYGPEFLSGLSGSWQEIMADLPQCSADDGMHSGTSTGSITPKGTQIIGGRQAQYYEAQLCASGYPQETLRMWEVKQPNMMISTLDRKGLKADMAGFFATASWK